MHVIGEQLPTNNSGIQRIVLLDERVKRWVQMMFELLSGVDWEGTVRNKQLLLTVGMSTNVWGIYLTMRQRQ